MQFLTRPCGRAVSRMRSGPVLLALLLAPALNAADLALIYDLSVQNDPQLGLANASFNAQRQLVPRARAGLLPLVTAGAQTSDNKRTLPGQVSGGTEHFNSHTWTASLEQPVFRPDRWFQFRQAKNFRQQAALNFAIAQQELMIRVTESYLRILEAQDGLAAARATHDAVKRQLQQVQQRYDVGLVAITDLLEAQAAFDAAEVTLIEARGAQDVSFEALRRLTGQFFDAVGGLEEEFPVTLPEPPSADAWAELALAQNLSVLAARQGLLAAEKGVRIAQSGHLPSVDASISRSENVNGVGNLSGVEVEQDVYGLSVFIPVYAGGRTRSLVREASFRREEAQRNLELQRRMAVELVRSRYSALETDVARVKSTLRGIESSKSALDATRTGYEVGTRNIVDVFNAQQRLYSAQFQYHSARYRYILDMLRLKQLVGSLSPEDVYTLNDFMQTGDEVRRIGR